MNKITLPGIEVLLQDADAGGGSGRVKHQERQELEARSWSEFASRLHSSS